MNILLFSGAEWGKPLDSKDYRAVHVREHLKLSKGDSLRVGLLDKGTGRAELLSDPGSDLNIEMKFPRELRQSLFPAVHLLIGHPRPPVFQRLVRDLASMGIHRISWLHTVLGEKSYLSSRVWQSELLEQQLRLGLEQGAHTSMPLMLKHYSVRRCLEHLEPDGNLRIVLHPPETDQQKTENPPLLGKVLEGIAPGSSLTIAIGADRGWTEEELQTLQAGNFLPAQLGPALLRTETAAILAAGMAMLRLAAADTAADT